MMNEIKNFLESKNIEFIEQNTKFHNSIVIEKNKKFIRITLCNYTDLTHNYDIYTIDKDFYVDTQKEVINFISKEVA